MRTVGKILIGIGLVIHVIAMFILFFGSIALGGGLGFLIFLAILVDIGLIVLVEYLGRDSGKKRGIGYAILGGVVFVLALFSGRLAINGVLYFIGGLILANTEDY